MPNKTAALCVLALSTALVAAGCDESEQDRILRYEKGVYLGEPDQPLSEEQVEQLRQRTRRQGAG